MQDVRVLFYAQLGVSAALLCYWKGFLLLPPVASARFWDLLVIGAAIAALVIAVYAFRRVLTFLAVAAVLIGMAFERQPAIGLAAIAAVAAVTLAWKLSQQDGVFWQRLIVLYPLGALVMLLEYRPGQFWIVLPLLLFMVQASIAFRHARAAPAA